jgi:predicted  nucleic acid-binding Zn-ribbon protein
MADDTEDYTLRLLQRLNQKIDKVELMVKDLRDGQHQMRADISALRGDFSATRHEVNIFAERWADHEVRLRAIEERSPPAAGEEQSPPAASEWPNDPFLLR